MWTEVVKAKGGCLLAHDMGLGKTMQCITLLVTIAEASKSGKETITKQIPDQLRESRTLVLCPPTLVENWCDELLTWVPRPYSDSVGEIRQVTAKLKPVERFSEIEEWADEGGVLVMSYDLFRGIVLPKKNLNAAEVDDSSKEEERLSQIRDILLKRPAIVITDEAQSFKSKTSKLHAALTKCETHSRIALTGSPISNNLLEYYMIVNFISPHYLGSESEFTQKYIEPIKEGLYQDASIPVQRNGAKMLEVLKTELNPIMHRIDWVSIQNQTRGKTEMIIRVCPTELQKICYNKYVDWILRGSDGPSGEPAKLWAWLSVLRLLLNHPRCFRDRLQAKVSNSGQEPNGPQDLSPEDKVMQDAERILQQPLTEVAGFSQPMITELLALTNAQGDEIDAIELSNKMIIVMGIINHTLRAGEKVLVFSHSIPTLDFVGDLLTKEGKRFDRLDGKLKMNLRQNLTKDFNTDNKTSILLISTRAGGTGLNLYGASRVIIIDDMFNPTWEKQAIGRAFRIGQQRHVYVYRLLVSGSFEEKLQNQALFKLQLATRVIDKKDTIRHALRGTANEYIFRLKDPDIENMESFKGDKLVLDKIIEVQKG